MSVNVWITEWPFYILLQDDDEELQEEDREQSDQLDELRGDKRGVWWRRYVWEIWLHFIIKMHVKKKRDNFLV